MSLDGTYAGLVSTLEDLIGRTDFPASDLVTLGEEILNQTLRLRCMQTSAQITGSSTPVALPADWLEYRSVVHTVVPYRALSLAPEQWANEHTYWWGFYVEPPLFYTIEGTNFRIVTKNAGSWVLDTNYYQKLDLVNDGSNAVFSKYPSLYLYSALDAYVQYNGQDARGPGWQAKFQDQLSKVISDDTRAKFSGSTLSMRVRRAP